MDYKWKRAMEPFCPDAWSLFTSWALACCCAWLHNGPVVCARHTYVTISPKPWGLGNHVCQISSRHVHCLSLWHIHCLSRGHVRRLLSGPWPTWCSGEPGSTWCSAWTWHWPSDLLLSEPGQYVAAVGFYVIFSKALSSMGSWGLCTVSLPLTFMLPNVFSRIGPH